MSVARMIIGSESGEHLAVFVSRREFPYAEDASDGNWVYATIRIRAGAFRGEYEALLRTDELAAFRSQLATLYEHLTGTATLESLEDWIRAEVVGDGRGHFVVKCKARDQPGIGNTLRFELAFDQTQLPAMLHDLDEVMRQFPVKGSPGR